MSSLFSQKRFRTQDNPAALVTIVLLFILSNGFALALTFIEEYADVNSILFVYLIDVSNTFVILCSTVNFFVYIAFDKRFRRNVNAAFGRKHVAFRRTLRRAKRSKTGRAPSIPQERLSVDLDLFYMRHDSLL